MESWAPPSSTIAVKPHPRARDQAVARTDIPIGATVLSVPAFASVLLDSQKGRRCDYCLRLPKEGSSLRRCTGCGAYWYCDTQCQNAQWQAHHKRICKKYNQFTSSVEFQRLETHEKMDSLLLTHVLAHLSTISTTYSPEKSKDLSILLSLLPSPSIQEAPPVCPVNPAPPSQEFVANIFSRFGNNNFTVHSHLSSIAHGVFPLASRLFNHSCVPNAATKYALTPSNTVTMEVVALRAIQAGEEICIPYIDPALLQSRHQVFQITYGFSCECPECRFLNAINPIPEPPEDNEQLKKVSKLLREFVGVDQYLRSDDFEVTKSLGDLPPPLYCVLRESYMTGLSEAFSKSSHENEYHVAADSGVTLLALYLLVYPINYPQIGMHLLEMAKTQWNHSFVILDVSEEEKREAKVKVSRLLKLASGVLKVLGDEGDDDGPLQEIKILEHLLQTV